MAYQDVAGPLSVKYSVTPADGLRWHVPRDCVATVHRPGGNSGTARPTAGITLVVTMRLGGLPSGGAHRLVLGGNFGDPLRMPADAEPQCSNPTCRSPSGQQPGLDSDSGCRSFGKAPGSTFGGQPPESLCSMPESRLSWRWKERRVFSREDAVATSATDWRRLQTDHAERESPTCCGVRHRYVPSSGGGERSRCCWGQLQCGHVGKGVTPVVAPGCVPWPFRGRRGGPGALELAPELPRARIRDLRLSWLGCGQRLPREPAEQLQAPGIILQRRHAPCDNPPFATPTCHQPLRAVWCAHILFGGCDPSVGRALRPPPFGRCDVKPRAPVPSLGRCDVTPCAPVPSLGRCDVTPCAPASRPCLSWEAGWRRCAATAPSYAEGGAVTLRGP